MTKNLFIAIFTVFWGLLLTPGFAVSSDPVKVVSPHFDAVETVPIVVESEPAIEASNEVVIPAAPVAGYSAPAPVWVPNYTVTVYSDKMIADGLSYTDIYKTRKVVYAHNTVNLFASLKTLGLGDKLTITESGVAREYVVSDIATYAKTADGNLENNPKLMRNIAYTAMGHSLALFTCAGTPYGNGDASHRLVVYIDEA